MGFGVQKKNGKVSSVIFQAVDALIPCTCLCIFLHKPETKKGQTTGFDIVAEHGISCSQLKVTQEHKGGKNLANLSVAAEVSTFGNIVKVHHALEAAYVLYLHSFFGLTGF